jgi:hypothetical protein
MLYKEKLLTTMKRRMLVSRTLHINATFIHIVNVNICLYILWIELNINIYIERECNKNRQSKQRIKWCKKNSKKEIFEIDRTENGDKKMQPTTAFDT